MSTLPCLSSFCSYICFFTVFCLEKIILKSSTVLSLISKPLRVLCAWSGSRSFSQRDQIALQNDPVYSNPITDSPVLLLQIYSAWINPKIILIGGTEANWFAVGGGERCYSWIFFFVKKKISEKIFSLGVKIFL